MSDHSAGLLNASGSRVPVLLIYRHCAMPEICSPKPQLTDRRGAEMLFLHRFVAGALVSISTVTTITVVPAQSQETRSPAVPALRINSPFAAPLWRIDVDREETTVVSSSAYKAVTIWPLVDPNAPRIARVPLRDEQRRRAHGVAIAPDGDIVAYSVPPLAEPNGTPVPGTGRIYLERASDGKLVRTIAADIPTRPQALKFSADGAYLGAVLSSGCGLRVWETRAWSLVTADDEGYAGTGAGCCQAGASAAQCNALPDTTGIAFAGTAAAPVLITSGDTGVRSYAFDGGRFVRRLVAASASIGLERPEGLAISPDGRSIAVADRRARGAERSDAAIVLRVAVLALDTLKPVRAPHEITMASAALSFPAYLDPLQVPDARLFSLHRLAWIKDGGGEWIYAGGFFACEAGRRDLVQPPAASRADVCIVRWSATRSGELPRFIPHGTDRIMDLVPLAKTASMLVATQRSITEIDHDGTPAARPDGVAFAQQNQAADFRGGTRLFNVSVDANKVIFDDYQSTTAVPVRLQFDAAALLVTENAPAEQTPFAPSQDTNILGDPSAPTDPRRNRWWLNTEGPPRFLGQPLVDTRLDNDDIYRAVALNLDGRLAVVGSANFLRVVGFGDGAPKIRCELPISEEAYRVNITPDASIIVAGHSDGVLRWYRHSATAEGCRIDLVLSVYLARTANGEWTWIAWVPGGEFANDPRARNLMSWQVSDAAGAVKSVDFSQLLAWYKTKVVASAVEMARSRPIAMASAEPRIAAALAQQIADKAGQQIVEVVSRIDRTEKEAFRYRIRVAEAAGWPKNLMVRTGEGHTIAIVPSTDAISSTRSQPVPALSVPAPGLLEFDLILPAAARLQKGTVDLCFYLDGQRQVCNAIQWIGPVAPPPPRRLWAIIAGFSKYEAADMGLRYAQNDAIDLARLFVDDFSKRGAKGGPIAANDFASINIDLAISANSPLAEAEAARLGEHVYVRRRPASRQGLLDALNDLVARSRTEELANDLFVFYFSGHGFANPFATDRGLTALATPATSGEVTPENFAATTLGSDELIGFVDRISGQKLVIIDACRTPPNTVRHAPFEAGKLTAEFAAGALTTYFFFSAKDGQFSVEQPDYAYDSRRVPGQQGNGLFTYGLLKAMVAPPTTLPGAPAGRKQRDTDEIFRYVEDQVFDLTNPDSIAKRLERSRSQRIVQTPVYVAGRPVERRHVPQRLVLRTLE